jgi:hypothetical protein
VAKCLVRSLRGPQIHITSVLVGHSGFTGSPTNLIAYALFLVAAVGLLITGLRSRASAAAIAVTR